ncbi:MAG: hypothetical protein HON90_16975 [Halobacteriovoraceae bacterium]|nr:hypothetical protein [Halobacteriovoraceae bacterium]
MAKAKLCTNLDSCVQLVSKLTNKNYLSKKKLKGEVNLSSNFKITKLNANDFISETLSLHGYTRVPSTSGDWTIINARDVRYEPTPQYIYGKDVIPKNHDHAMATFKLINPKISREIARNFRPFMSRYGRIIDLKTPGIIIISDTGKNIHRLGKLVTLLDKKPTRDENKEYEKSEERRNKLKMIKAKNCGDISDDLAEIKALLLKNN